MHHNFLKMHGTGNDFVIFDQRSTKEYNFSPKQIKSIANRRTGIGCDQIIVIRKSSKADCKVLIFNQDGSRSGACGNASRCIAKIINKPRCHLHIDGRILEAKLNNKHVEVDMGPISFEWDKIPLLSECDAFNIKLDHPQFNNGVCANIGNPHLILLIDDLDKINIAEYGTYFEKHKLFPEGINVNFAQILDKKNIKLKVWERGAGATLACGSGACATAAVLFKKGLVQNKTQVHLPGGTLTIKCNLPNQVLMSGPATYVFSGKINLTNR